MAGDLQRYKCVSCGKRYSLDTRPKAYPPALRDRARELRTTGASVRQVAHELGVSPQTISVWDRAAPVAEIVEDRGARPTTTETPLKPRVTIADVARQASVSVSTVSNYLNDKGRMSHETRVRIGDAMKALYFTPNALIRAIRNRRMHTLGLVTYGIYDLDKRLEWSVVAPLLAAINRAADRANYDVLLYTGWPHRSRSRAGSDFLNGQVDGLLWVSPQPDVAQLRFAAAAGLPVMALLTSKVPEGVGFVVADNVGGVRDLVAHLAHQGHRRIAHLGSKVTSDLVERAAGYRAGLDAAGLPFDPDLLTTALRMPWTPSHIATILDCWLSLADRPTAIVAADDGLAALAIDALQELGWKVPDDMAIAGFDDLPASAHLGIGGLTTVHQPFSEIGSIAVERLDALIQGAPLSECRITVPVSLTIRSSTKPPTPLHP